MPAPTISSTRLSFVEYFALPTDEERTELVYGECVVSPRPSEEHNDLVHDLAEVLKRWVRHHQLGKVSIDIDVVFDEPKDLVYAPDILFTRKTNRARRAQGRLYGVPDLCIEVLSPSERPWLQNRKFADYESYGVRTGPCCRPATTRGSRNMSWLPAPMLADKKSTATLGSRPLRFPIYTFACCPF